jgi:hypothetical protein
MKAKWAFLVVLVLLLLAWPCDGLAGGINDGLIGHWDFEEDAIEQVTVAPSEVLGFQTSVLTIRDRSRHGHTGNIIGNVSFQPGIIGQAAVFDGETSLIRVEWSPRLSLGDSDFTVAMWVCPEGDDSQSSESSIDANAIDSVSRVRDELARLVDHRGTGLAGVTPGWQVKIRTTEAGWFLQGTALDDGFGTMFRVDTSTIYPTERWAHLCVVLEAGHELSVFLNGVCVHKEAISDLGILDNGLPMFIGGTALANGVEGTPAQVFSGMLDDVRLYGRALDRAEITELYSKGAQLHYQNAFGVHFADPR